MSASEPGSIQFADLQRLFLSESPDLAESVMKFLEQDDPVPDSRPAGAITLSDYKQSMGGRMRWKSKAERRQLRKEALHNFLTQKEMPLPPRVGLADLLVEAYNKNTPALRRVLCELAREAPLRFGLWGGLKRIYKLSEERLDAELFGVLAFRFDRTSSSGAGREVGGGTMVYLRRRAGRFLKRLGRELPTLYPQFAVQLLRHYGSKSGYSGMQLAAQVWPSVYSYDSSRKKGSDPLKGRAFDEAWKLSAEPLMLLLETCQGDAAAAFAILSLRRDFPLVLRGITPTWLARLATKPLGSAHDFLIDTLGASPEFHSSKLKALGLHEAVLALLLSPSARARTFAIEYARAHAQDLPSTRMVEYLRDGEKETRAFALAQLSAKSPQQLGYVLLAELLSFDDSQKFAEKALETGFERKDLPHDFLIDQLYGEEAQSEWAQKFLTTKCKPEELGVAFWKRILDDKRGKDNDDAFGVGLDMLDKLPVSAMGVSWLIDGLMRSELEDAAKDWLMKADSIPGFIDAASLERLKGLVLHVKYRKLVLPILENRKLIKPRELGLSWLLALARRADETLHTFAHRYLLCNMSPADFADSGDLEAGTARLFALATADKEPEPVRVFAQTYLRCHHPTIGAEQSESKAQNLKPQLKLASYTAERVWPGLSDARADVRRFAVTIARADLRRWGYQTRVYELVDSEAKEVRNLAYDALLKAGDSTADLAHTLKVDELLPAPVFALTESRKRHTREVGMELIRRHYQRLGGSTRLGWLMESPDREVRLFAVRLLWEKHRPLQLPEGWKPSGKAPPIGIAAERGSSGEGRAVELSDLQGFLRRLLFGLPPGRSMEPKEDGGPRRHIAASVAKRQVIEIVRDLGLEDEAFAQLVLPVLSEFTGSLARTEWQACLAAVLQLQKAHPKLAALTASANGSGPAAVKGGNLGGMHS